jgi:CHAT domain-containing protein/Tfp pilus assembly protein PilF
MRRLPHGHWCVLALFLILFADSTAAQPPAPAPTEPAAPLESRIAALFEERRFAEAIPLAEQLVAETERARGPQHADLADALGTLSQAQSGAGQAAQAVASLSRAIKIRDQVAAPDDPMIADDCNALAVIHFGQGNYRAAEPLMTRALAIRERALGPEAPETAQSVNNLAQVYQELGDYTAAEPLLQRALTMYEKARGPEHADVAIALNNLAGLYSLKGDYQRASPLYTRTLAMREKLDGPDSLPTAVVLNNFGLMYQREGALDRARPLFERSLAIREQKLGPSHIDVARVLNNLAIVHQEQADLGTAEQLYTRALAIYEKVLGPNHPLVGQTVNNLAVVYVQTRDFAKAEPLFARAIEIRRATQGPRHPDMNRALTSQAVLFDLTGRLSEAVRLQGEATEVGEHNLSLVLASGSEAQKLRYMETFAEGTDVTVSLHRRSAPEDEQATRLALTTVLRRKGRVLDAMSHSLQSVREQLTPEGRAALDELAAARGDLARLVLRGPGRMPREDFDRNVAALEERTQTLEASLSRQSAAFRAQSVPITVSAVQAAVPADGALVEFVAYRPFDPLAVRRDARFGPSRYVAFIVDRERPPVSVDLGETSSMDAVVDRFRRALRDPADASVETIARDMYARVMAPLRQRLGDRSTLYISPDAALNLIPFAALVDDAGRSLVDTHTISYLTSGRDLLQLDEATPVRAAAMVVANPQFGERGEVPNPPSGDTRALDLSRARFVPLPGTAGEAVAVGSMLEGAVVYTDTRATEAVVKAARGPRILHVATHGFFLDPGATVSVKDGRMLVMDQPTASGADALDNPLLRSGLAFAGANRRDGGDGEDGILTALEATALDLWGTRLAVLSACETGVGESRRGDGVYGLRRALVMAGAESQLMTLWQVSDLATRDLMIMFYHQLGGGNGRAEALRRAQREMRASDRRRHPYYWASFILSGDAGPMR